MPPPPPPPPPSPSPRIFIALRLLLHVYSVLKIENSRGGDHWAPTHPPYESLHSNLRFCHWQFKRFSFTCIRPFTRLHGEDQSDQNIVSTVWQNLRLQKNASLDCPRQYSICIDILRPPLTAFFAAIAGLPRLLKQL